MSGRSTCVRGRFFPFRFAVPGESFGLTLFLRFSDRCRNPAMPFSATGSGIPGFRARQRLIGSIATRGKRATNQALLRPTSDTCSCAEDKSLPRTDKSPPRFFCFNEPGPVIPTDPSYYVKHQDQEISGFNIHFHLVKQVRTKPKWDEQSLHFMKNSLQRVWQAEHPACPNIKACILCQL